MQNNELERIHKLEITTTVLARDSEIQTRSLEKIEDVIDRAETHVEALNRQIIIYEDRLRNQERLNERVDESLKEIDQKLENFMTEMELKINDAEEKRMEFLADLKEEIITQIKAKSDTGSTASKDDKQFKVYRFLVDNWKYIAFAVAIIGGLLFHKWGVLAWLLSTTS